MGEGRSMEDGGGGGTPAPAIKARSATPGTVATPPAVGFDDAGSVARVEAPVEPADPSAAEVDEPAAASDIQAGGKPAAKDAPPSMLDRLFAGKGELPPWAAELIAEQEGGEFTYSDEEIENLPIEAKKLIATALLRGQKAKTELQADLEARQALAKQAEKRELDAKKLEADSFKWVRDPALVELLKKLAPNAADAPPDPNSREGIEFYSRQAAAETIGKWFEALQQADQRITEQSKQAQAEAELAEKRTALEAYVNENAEDFADTKIRDRIKDIVNRSKGAISAQEAHQFVMGQLALEGAADQKAARAEARRRVSPSSRAGGAIPEMPSHIRGDTEAEVRWYAQNPEAEARDLRRLEEALAFRPRNRRG